MTTEVICVSSRQDVDSCMKLMTEHRVRHLPVVENGQLAGLISIGDVVKARLGQLEQEIESEVAGLSSSLDAAAVVGVLLIILGVIVINVFSEVKA